MSSDKVKAAASQDGDATNEPNLFGDSVNIKKDLQNSSYCGIIKSIYK